MSQAAPHEPVLLREALALLAPKQGSTIVDATLGAGGHAEALLEAVGPTGRVVGIDRDPSAVELARQRLARFGQRFTPLVGDHRDLPRLLDQAGIQEIACALFDLGLNSMQLEDPQRGFSFMHDGPLDMRMDPRGGATAAQLLADLSEEELRRMLWRFGEEPLARPIARAIVRRRAERPLLRTRELAELVQRAVGPRSRRSRIHPATRTFQALRITVNQELAGLEQLLEQVVARLGPGGRTVWISFHSLEDRPVKRAMRSLAQRCTCPPRLPVCACGKKALVRILTPRPLRPSAAEVERNPRARSAKLRAAEKL